MSVGLIYDGGTAILEGIGLKIRAGKAVSGDAEALNLDGTSLNQTAKIIKPVNYSVMNLWNFVRKSPLLVAGLAIGMGILVVYFFLVVWTGKKEGCIVEQEERWF